MNFVFRQPNYFGIRPTFSLKFETVEDAQQYKDRLIQRMQFYIDRKLNGFQVGEKTIEDLTTELEEIKALEIVKV